MSYGHIAFTILSLIFDASLSAQAQHPPLPEPGLKSDAADSPRSSYDKRLQIQKMRAQLTDELLRAMPDDSETLLELYTEHAAGYANLPLPAGSYIGGTKPFAGPRPDEMPAVTFAKLMDADIARRVAAKDLFWRAFEDNTLDVGRHGTTEWMRRHPGVPWAKEFLEQAYGWYLEHRADVPEADLGMSALVSGLGDERWLSFFDGLEPADQFYVDKQGLEIRISRAYAMGTTLMADPTASQRWYAQEAAKALAGQPAFPKLPPVEVAMAAALPAMPARRTLPPSDPAPLTDIPPAYDTRAVWAVLGVGVLALGALVWRLRKG